MPEILVPIAFFAVIALVVKWSLDYKRWKMEHQGSARSTSDDSLRASELKALIREAVEEANAPLTTRLDGIEARLNDAELSREVPLLDAPLDAYDPVRVPQARSQRVA